MDPLEGFRDDMDTNCGSAVKPEGFRVNKGSMVELDRFDQEIRVFSETLEVNMQFDQM